MAIRDGQVDERPAGQRPTRVTPPTRTRASVARRSNSHAKSVLSPSSNVAGPDCGKPTALAIDPREGVRECRQIDRAVAASRIDGRDDALRVAVEEPRVMPG